MHQFCSTTHSASKFHYHFTKEIISRYVFLLGDHSFSVYAQFSKKLTFLTPWYPHIRVCITEYEMSGFLKKIFICTKWMILTQSKLQHSLLTLFHLLGYNDVLNVTIKGYWLTIIKGFVMCYKNQTTVFN